MSSHKSSRSSRVGTIGTNLESLVFGYVLTGEEEEAGGLSGLEVERDFVVGGEDGVDAAATQVVGDVLAAPEGRLGRQNSWNHMKAGKYKRPHL